MGIYIDDKELCKRFYNIHKHNEFILSGEEIERKRYGFFNIWSSHMLKCGDSNFGFKSGIYVKYSTLTFLTGRGYFDYFEISLNYHFFLKEELIYSENKISFENKSIKCDNEEIKLVKQFIDFYKNEKESIENKEKLEKEKKQRRLEEERKKEERERFEKERISKEKLEISKSNYLLKLDKDQNGEIDLMECDSYIKLLNTKQKSIIEIDKTYIQKFVKISIYIKTKKSNIQELFKKIKSVKNENELKELVGLLKNQVHTYNSLIFHSINMIVSLTDSDLITFYEIYECFDQLGVFNSNWENEVSTNLLNINSSINEVNQSIINLGHDITTGLRNLMYSINERERKIIYSLEKLTYTTQDSFRNLNKSVSDQLFNINSNLNFNNILTGIQTYQMYKINQNTKRIG